MSRRCIRKENISCFFVIFNGICAIDLDNCVTDSGYYTGVAAEIVTLMHSYTEYSPSGNGLHILFRADGFQYDLSLIHI